MMRAVIRTHLILMIRNRGVWAVTAISLVLAGLAARQGALSRMFYNWGELASPFFYLGQMLVTVAAAGRERTERVEELLEPLPYRPAVWVGGRFLVAYAGWLCISLLLWAAGGGLVAAAGHPLDVTLLIVHWAWVAPATLLYTTGLAFAIGTRVRRAVVAYFLTACAWIAPPFGYILVAKSSPLVPVPLGEYFASGRAFPLSAAGYLTNGTLLLLNRAFVIGLGVAAVGALVWLTARQRRVPGAAAAAVVAGALALSVGAAASSQTIWADRHGAYEAEMAVAAPAEAARLNLEAATFRVERYDIDLQVQPHSRSLKATARLEIAYAKPEDELVLTLRRDLTVTGVAGPDGAPLSFDRKVDWVVVKAPPISGGRTTLTVAYEGEVWQWRLYDGPKLGAHILPESLFLPANWGWYPIPGQRVLTHLMEMCMSSGCGPGLNDASLAHAPSSVDLKVLGTSLNLVHNAGENTAGLYLIGTPFETEVHSGLPVTVSPVNRVQGARIAREISQMAAFYEQLIPRNHGPLQVVEVHDALVFGRPWSPVLGSAPGAIVLHSMEVGRFWDGYFTDAYHTAVSNLWWPLTGVIATEQDHLSFGFSQYMHTLFKGERSDSDLRQQNPVVKTLQAVEDAKGREAAVAILRLMHARIPHGGPANAEFVAEVTRVAGDSDAVMAQLARLRGRRP